MELNTEINRVFGQEMAKLFSSHISDEELLTRAKEVWHQMTREEYVYGQSKGSQIDNIIKREFGERMAGAVRDIVQTEEFAERSKKEAEAIVTEIVTETHKKMVEEVSSRLAGMSVGGYGMGLHGIIEEVVASMMTR